MKLIQGEKYILKHTGEFCHIYTKTGMKAILNNEDENNYLGNNPFIFVDQIILNEGYGSRNIFYNTTNGYVMFGAKRPEEYAIPYAETIELTIEEIAKKVWKNPKPN